MRPLLHPRLVNGRTGDPALYLETLFERRAMLFDLGDIAALSPRDVQRLHLVCVSHAHIDHFFGFDTLLRLLVGREQQVRLFGPPGFADRVAHRLGSYSWNLVAGYASDLVFRVTEFAPPELSTTCFRLKTGFAREPGARVTVADSVIYREPAFSVTSAQLDHRGLPCLAFAVAESMHVNIWKPRLVERGLPVGAWLRELKRAVMAGAPDEHRLCVPGADGEQLLLLGDLRELYTITPGQKIGYVTDVADTPANRSAIVELVRDADLLFIEAAFAAADAEIASARGHLTTTAAGAIARAAGVRRVEPFHFSPRYAGEDSRLCAEVQATFSGLNPSRMER